MANLVDNLALMPHKVRRKFARVLEQLNDDYWIRSIVRDGKEVAQLVVEGPNRQWLFISYFPVFPEAHQVERYCSFDARLQEHGLLSVPFLIVTDEGESLLDQQDSRLAALHNISKEQFYADGPQLVMQHLLPVGEKQQSVIRQSLFAEASIKPIFLTARAPQTQDKPAKLYLDFDQERATKLDMFTLPAEDSLIDSDSEEIAEGEQINHKLGGTSVRLINGVAGSGKTLILINRAIMLAEKYPKKDILLLIHNRPITTEVSHKIATASDTGIPVNLTVSTFHKFALQQQRKVAGPTQPVFDADKAAEYLGSLLSPDNPDVAALSLTQQQLMQELEFINDHLINTEADYLEVERYGRGFALAKKQRGHVWQIYSQAKQFFAQNKEQTWASLYIKHLCTIANFKKKLQRYDHILLDEAQFFAPSWLTLVKLSLTPKGQLFMCADPNQGFLRTRLSWKSIGLNVRGRTLKLNYSYRTTKSILRAANALIADLEAASDDYLTPEFAGMEEGKPPSVIYSSTQQDERQRFINELTRLTSGNRVPLGQILVLCTQGENPWQLKALMEQHLGAGRVLNCNENQELDRYDGQKIRLMSIEKCTGVEAAIVFVLGVGNILQMLTTLGVSEEEQRMINQIALRKLYVAMTRAGQDLLLLSTKALPANVEALTCVNGEC